MMRAVLPLLAVICAIPVAAASARGGADSGGFGHDGFWADHAAIAGTVTSVGNGSFSADAYALAPGAGNSSAPPSTTTATITLGSGTRVVTAGQAGIVSGDDFYAVYTDVPAGSDLASLAADTPAVVYAYAAPTPEVEVKGVVTTAPASGSDSFTATAFVVAPEHFFPGGAGGADGDSHHPGSWSGGAGSSDDAGDPSGTDDSSGDSSGDSYSDGGKVGGAYGYSGSGGSGGSGSSGGTGGSGSSGGSIHINSVRGAHLRSHSLPAGSPMSDGTPGTMITTDSSTQITIGGQTSSVSNLAVGDYFTAVYDGTPDEPLSTITSTPALSVDAWAPFDGGSLYAFVGTVSSVDTTGGSVTVNVTSSLPNGLFSGTDTFDVSSQTIVLGNSGSSLFGSLSAVQTGDVVAGGLIAPGGESAGTVESSPLQVLVDFPQSSSSSSTTQQASIRRAERRALRLLRREKAKYGRHKRR